MSSTMNANRRRVLAGLGALGLWPAGAAIAEEKKPVKLRCSASEVTMNGMHRFDVHLVDGRLDSITATMHVDLDSFNMIVKGDDPRQIDWFYDGDTNWSDALLSAADAREKALGTLADKADESLVKQRIAMLRDSPAVGMGMGWLEISFIESSGRLIPHALLVQFPPLGVGAGRDNEHLGAVISAGGKQLASGDMKIDRKAAGLKEIGPAPVMVISPETSTSQVAAAQAVAPVVEALAKGQQLDFTALDGNGKAIWTIETDIAFRWPREIGVFKTLAPRVEEKVAAARKGDASACVKEGCFFTTAAVGTVGLPDDCWELETLRRFRDGWLARQSGGGELIARYYASAPQIVARIGARHDARRIWLVAYAAGILPAAICIRLGWNRLALLVYRRMSKRLLRFSA